MSDARPTPNCPDAATLRALLDGTLPIDQQAATQAHVDRCPSCEAALRQMTAGGESWIGMSEKLNGVGSLFQIASNDSEDQLSGRRPEKDSRPPLDPKLAAAMERLKNDDGSGDESSEPADPQRTLDFLQPADDPKLLGKLGQHEISEVIGWGGMGVVLKAYDPSLHRVVAVKVLASHLAHHAVARKRFIREAQAAAAVCHDNVITIHAIEDGHVSGTALAAGFSRDAVGTTPVASAIPLTGSALGVTPLHSVLPKIIMQFVAGGSLQERIDQDGPLELKEVLRIAMQTAAGLAAAHAQGVVHRDVKPANILLENGVERVKLTDFGLARVMDDASLTLSGVIAGTPQYMAPEQAWGRDVDARADLFSLGAVMYAMCSGHSPFRARTTMAVLKRVCEDPPRPLRAINPDVPEWLVAIIEKLLAKNPDERFQSATEVSELLGRWLAHVQQPTVVSPPVGQAFQLDRNAPQNAVRPSTDSSKTRLARPSGQPGKADLRTDVPLSAKVALLPMLGIGTTVAIMLLLIVAAGETNNLPSFLGFAAWNLLATFAVCSIFRTAWNTSSWLIWTGAVLLLPVVGQGFVMASSYQPNPTAPQLIFAVQALTAFALLFGLLFVRPFFVRGSERWMRERLTGWQRLFAIACFTIIGTPLTLAVMYWLPGTGFQVRPKSTPMTSEAAPQKPLGSQAFPKPRLLSESKKVLLDVDDIEEPQPIRKSPGAIADSLKPLQGRWVVVSSEGAALGSAALISGSGGSPFGPAVPGAAGGGPMSAGGGMSGFGMSSMGANFAVPSLQWIEFAAEQVVVFDGREAKLFAEFSEDGEPKQLSLRHYSEQLPAAVTVWRNGIYRLDRDRLIICWTNHSQPVPTEFAGDIQQGVQLLVLRREWNPPPDFSLPGDTPPVPPRAVIPFTADEAQRFQVAWARSANVPVETTNSLGMKLRVLPPGAFDPTGTKAFSKSPMLPIVGGFSQPIYMATREVTVAQFRKFVEATQYETIAERFPPELGSERRTWQHPGIVQDSDQHPVVRVSWQDAQAFCRWLSDTEQQQYRLPTITEWAFAARAGLASTASLKLPHNARLRFFDTTAPVGGDNANLFGLHDIFGNVSEWTNDNLGADNPDALSPQDKDHPPQPFFMRTALGGGYQSSRKREDNGREEWMLLQVFGTADHEDDVGFRVARVITRDVEVLSGSWPHVKGLIATSTHAAIPFNADRTKTSEPKTPPDDFAKVQQASRPVVAIRGLVPMSSFTIVPNFVDFEIERGNTSNEDANAKIEPGSKISWKKVDLANTLKVLDEAALVDSDPIPALLRNPVFTSPLPVRADSPWPKDLITHPRLPLTPPKSKYEVQQALFRFFDFDVASGNQYSYRVRLKFMPTGKQKQETVLFTPWSSNSNWATVEELRDEQER